MKVLYIDHSDGMLLRKFIKQRNTIIEGCAEFQT